MNTCGDCPRRPAVGSAPHGLSKEGSCWVFSGGRRLELGKVGRIDVPRPERAHATGTGAHVPFQALMKGARGSCIDEAARQPTTLRQFYPAPARKRERGSRSARSRHRAVQHDAAGGWMTARWSGAVLGQRGGNAPDHEGGLEVERWRVFPRRSAGSLQRWCLSRVLVT